MVQSKLTLQKSPSQEYPGHLSLLPLGGEFDNLSLPWWVSNLSHSFDFSRYVSVLV